jgi:hypothetical protein
VSSRYDADQLGEFIERECGRGEIVGVGVVRDDLMRITAMARKRNDYRVVGTAGGC